jgi:hypothetical protein
MNRDRGRRQVHEPVRESRG